MNGENDEERSDRRSILETNGGVRVGNTGHPRHSVIEEKAEEIEQEEGETEAEEEEMEGFSTIKYRFGLHLSDSLHVVPEEAPPHLMRYLLDGEQSCITVHQHPAALGKDAAIVSCAFLAALALNGWMYSQGVAVPFLVHVLWILFLIILGRYAAKAAVWRCTWIIVTPIRMIRVSGVFSRKVEPLPVKKIRDMQLIQTPIARRLGYGTLQMESLGTGHALHHVDFVPNVDATFRAIWQLIEPKKGTMPAMGGE